jgi:hypothetical protein
MRWLSALTVVYVVALAGATGCTAFVKAALLRHREDAPPGRSLP